jgi:serine/threonine-protein kinase
MPEVPVPRTPVPEIRQVAVVPPPAPVPDPGAVATAIQALPCSLLRVGLSGQTLAVSGLTRATEAAAMRRDIAAAGLSATAARLAVDTFTAPYCDTLDIVRPVVVLGDDAPGFRFTSPNPLRGGQALQFAVSLPAWPARLHIAYVTETGAVGHLVQGGAAYPAGGSATFGDGTRWSATAPFGTDLLLVIASERPLFAQRRRGETLDEFNAALQAALRALPPGDRAAIRVALLHTVPGP